MLNHYCRHQHSIVVETKTTAAASCTSTNLLFHVSLLLAAPRANSWLHYGLSDHIVSGQDGEGKEVDSLWVLAAHAGAVLLEVRSSRKHRYGSTKTSDYFVYETGTAAARLQSLLKLPGCYDDKESQRLMGVSDTGLLRCGEHELLVAHLEVNNKKSWDSAADLCILRVGQEWELKQEVPIIFDDHQGSNGDAVTVMWRWLTDTTVPVGDRFLCWVDFLVGFLFCDMAAHDASLKLRYVALPVLPPKDVDYWDGRSYKRYCRDLAGAGAGVVRFVSIEPRCCCGGHGRSTCARGQFLFTVTTWTLSLSMDEPLHWVKESVLDCSELWALPAYKGLPQVTLKLPIVSLDNPDVIWFVVPEDVQDYAKFSDRRAWMVKVDTRSKVLLSVVPYTDSWASNSHIAVKLRC
jgi:hypothetical protein